jgi:hypothetical protein
MARRWDPRACSEEEEHDGDDECGSGGVEFTGEHDGGTKDRNDQHDPDEIASGFALSTLEREGPGGVGRFALSHVKGQPSEESQAGRAAPGNVATRKQADRAGEVPP